jgi:hypothetical protein
MAAYGQSRKSTASPEQVWSIWSEPSTWQEWNPDVSKMEMDGPFAEGTTGRMHTPSGRVHNITLRSVRPGKGFEVHTKVIPGTAFAFVCEIKPQDGGSEVSQTIRISGPMAPVFGRAAGPRIAASFGPLLEGLTKKAEGST